LEQTPGLAERTVVVYTSDHGEMAGENGLWWKTTFYEGSVKVPLIVACPSAFKAGLRRKEVVSLMDIGATLVDLAKAGPWPENAGTTLVPLLDDQPVNWASEAFSEYPPELGWGLPAERKIRAGEWKLVHYDQMRPQLFNLRNDPHEFNDLGEDGNYSAIRDRLLKRALQGWSAERITSELSKRARESAIISRWYARVNPPRPPAEWVAPPGSNVYPEPE
jgi:choline-sulfatase